MPKPASEFFDIAYLGMYPVAHKSEGLNVLLCDTIKPLIDRGIKVRIHTTRRHVNAIRSALDGNQVNLANLELRAYRVQSLSLTFWAWRSNKNKKTNKNEKQSYLSFIVKKLNQLLISISGDFVKWALDVTVFNAPIKLSILLVVVFALGLLLLALGASLAVFAVCFAPIIVLKLLIVALKRVLMARPVVRSYFGSKFRELKAAKLDIYCYLQAYFYKKEQIRFADSVNKNSQIKKMFFFTAFDGHAVMHFKGAKLTVMPDIVTSVFPLRFSEAINAAQIEEMRLAVLHTDALVCYSKYVRDQQLLRVFPIEARGKRIVVIPQGYFGVKNVDNDHFLSVKNFLNGQRSLIKNVFPTLMFQSPVVDFTQFNYILYPTVDRPHKNMLTLVRAFSKVLREKHRNVKLVLTTPDPTGDVAEYIVRNRLHYDVIFMPTVPLNVLDKLFQGASLMVHSSLAEGGDVFNFSRAATVSTPSLLADVAVVREMFERGSVPKEQYEEWLFHPADFVQLANKIDEILCNPKEFTEKQFANVENLSEYSFFDMANRYLELYESI